MAIEIKSITQNNVKVFSAYLAPEVVADIEAGAHITALGAFSEGECLGAIAGSITDDHEFTISSLYVAPSARRQGAGTKLIDAVNDLLIPFEARMEISYNELDEEKEILTEFLLLNGYEFDSAAGPAYYMSTLEEVLDSEVIRQVSKGGKNDNIIPFEKVSDQMIDRANEYADEEGAPLPPGGLAGDAVDASISMAYVEKDTVKAYIAVEKVEEGLLDISAVYDGKCGPNVLIALIKSALDVAKDKYPGSTKLVSCAINERSEKLLEQIFGDNIITRKLCKRAEYLFTDQDIECMAARSLEYDDKPIINLSELPEDADISEFITPDEPDPDDVFAEIEYDPEAPVEEEEPIYIGRHDPVDTDDDEDDDE